MGGPRLRLPLGLLSVRRGRGVFLPTPLAKMKIRCVHIPASYEWGQTVVLFTILSDIVQHNLSQRVVFTDIFADIDK